MNQLGTSAERREILQGLLDFRAALRQVGITSGFQILDGSFVEDCESQRGRPPGDIDLVTYAYLPVGPLQAQAFHAANLALFDPPQTKLNYKCDAYFVDLAKSSELIVDDTFYWYGLFSHQKMSHTWKGTLRIPLMADDAAAAVVLTNLGGNANGP